MEQITRLMDILGQMKFDFEIESKNEKYLFIKADEEGSIVKETRDLNEFEGFCHYCGDNTWKQLKPVVVKHLKKYNIYALDGNDTLYYIIQHPMWN